MILVSLIFLFIFPIESHADVIVETCKNSTKHYGLCVSTLQSDKRSWSADPKGLAAITLDIVLHKANLTFHHSLALFRSTTDPVLYRIYGTCLDVYGGSVNRLLPEASKTLKSDQYSTAQQDAEQVASNAVGCQQQFGFGIKSPFGNENNDVHDLATVAADIIGSLG